MNTPRLFGRNQATLKLLFVGGLSLAMLIPLYMVRTIVLERQDLQFAAENTIAKRWGGVQRIGGLVALTEEPARISSKRESRLETVWTARLPAELHIEAGLTTEMRYLGIYEVAVYTSRVKLKGRLDRQWFDRLQPGSLLLWLPLSDMRGVREVLPLRLGDLEMEAQPLAVHANTISGLQFSLGEAQRQSLAGNGDLHYELELVLAGSGSLLFLPLADRTQVRLDADWPHPEFIGQYLPTTRSISPEGTRAEWQLLGLNRPFGDHWKVADMPFQQLNHAGFGMRLETLVDGYQRSERSLKYGVLFISLTFFTLFLFEVMTGQPLHPVPYLLTGSALAVFYLLLLALSEYLAFPAAFVLASVALVAIVTPYAGAVLGGWRRGLLVGAMMGSTYALLYVLVTAEHAALLLGSLALLAAIAGLMYLTRRVDWYGYGSEPA